MNKNLIYIFVLFLFFASVSFVLAQTPLEVKYPIIFGTAPTTLEGTTLVEYVNYIFNFVVATAGIVALVLLTYSGLIYLTSAGRPEKLKEAKKQILAALLGVVIIISSYLILHLINPELTVLKLREPIELSITPSPSTIPLPGPIIYRNWLWRITEIADRVKELATNQDEGIKKIAQDINYLTSLCSCIYTQPMCVCQDYQDYRGCKALYCYSASETQPCPDGPEIKKEQKDIIASLFEIIYYKNRAIDERKDFLSEIENLRKEILYYEEKIKEEEQKEQIEEIIEKKEKLIEKAKLYQDLEKELEKLAKQIQEIIFPINNLAKLPDECLTGVKEKCAGSCQGGCHDVEKCAPYECQGKEEGKNNPCPEEIKGRAEEIGSRAETIKKTCDKIIEIIEKITTL